MRWNPFRRTSREAAASKISDHAVERAKEHLEAVQSKAPEVDAVTKHLRELREQNHFAEMIRLSMRGV